MFGPRDVPHTFTVSSDEAHFLLVVEPAGFENFLPSSPSRPRHQRFRPHPQKPPHSRK